MDSSTPYGPQRERLPSTIYPLPNGRKLDVRAHQRTYEGAYTRTAIGCLSFALLVLKLFSKEFMPLGAVYTAYGCIVYFFGVAKSRQVEFYYNPNKDQEMFKTAGDSVLFLSIVSLVSYIAILSLILRM
ncbi:uncharacterized protein PRCAT00003791001 [Priceomyces carsonii]|uniref:uncharacterized protein n=1 Tax=Priceomyces carsonii TaxID=28549 RepID=UPI002EDA0A1A|nr:unnamed protein product [Priceomyces carsonii]